MGAPVSLAEKRAQALGVANDVRSRRKELRRRLARGEERPGPHIATPAWWLRTARVDWLLLVTRGLGEASVEPLLEAAGVLANQELGRLQVAERLRLIEALRDVGTEERRAA